MKVLTDIWLVQLGWAPLRGALPVSDGPVEFRVVAPWCTDCQDWGPRVSEGVQGAEHPIFLVGEFSPAADIMEYTERYWLPGLPVLAGTSEKSEVARIQARFRQLRAAVGDGRKWGVPTVIQGEIRNGRLLVKKLFDPSA